MADQQTPIETNGEGDPKLVSEVRGLPKSGRWWKQTRTQPHSSIVKVPSLKSSWSKKLRQRQMDQKVKAVQAEIRESLSEKKAAKLKEKKEREDRRKANERKGEVVQVIKNSNKLKRAKKRQLRKVQTRDTTAMETD